MSDARAGLSSTKISVSQAIVAAIVYCASFFIFTPIAYAELQLCLNDRCDLKKLGITGRQELVGIAMYLNGVKTYHVNAEQIREISDGTNVQLEHISIFSDHNYPTLLVTSVLSLSLSWPPLRLCSTNFDTSNYGGLSLSWHWLPSLHSPKFRPTL